MLSTHLPESIVVDGGNEHLDIGLMGTRDKVEDAPWDLYYTRRNEVHEQKVGYASLSLISGISNSSFKKSLGARLLGHVRGSNKFPLT